MKEIYVLPDPMNKRLISTLMSNKPTNPQKTASFSLKSTSEFASRSCDVFGKLQLLEKNHEAWMSENTTLESFDEARNIVCKKSESEIFKKPMPTKLWKPRSTASPFKRRPAKKWKKYSLADVPVSSDASNTAIALQCISELRKRKEKSFDTDDSTKKIVFTKPTQKEKSACIQGSTHTYKNKPSLKQTGLKEYKDQTMPPKIELCHLQDDDCDSM